MIDKDVKIKPEDLEAATEVEPPEVPIGDGDQGVVPSSDNSNGDQGLPRINPQDIESAKEVLPEIAPVSDPAKILVGAELTKYVLLMMSGFIFVMLVIFLFLYYEEITELRALDNFYSAELQTRITLNQQDLNGLTQKTQNEVGKVGVKFSELTSLSWDKFKVLSKPAQKDIRDIKGLDEEDGSNDVNDEQLGLFKELSDSSYRRVDEFRKFWMDVLKIVLINVLLPVLTAILGYTFGTTIVNKES